MVKKLRLNKSIIATLGSNDQSGIYGGATMACGKTQFNEFSGCVSQAGDGCDSMSCDVDCKHPSLEGFCVTGGCSGGFSLGADETCQWC